MRYLLVDRITELIKGERIKGIKNVAMTEDFLEFHFPRAPVMPGVMILEAIVQLTGWLEAASSDFRNWFALRRVIKCNFYGLTLPGDQLELEVQHLEDGRYGAVALVEGKRRVKAEFEGDLVPLEEIEDAEELVEYIQDILNVDNFKVFLKRLEIDFDVDVTIDIKVPLE